MSTNNQFTEFASQTPRVGQRQMVPRNVTARLMAQGSVTNQNIQGSLGSSANTPSSLVLRDTNGNFSATTISANLNGNVTGIASGNELPLSFTLPLQRSGNIIGLSYTPVNKAGDTLLGDMTFNGNVILSTLGKSLRIKEGTNACLGVTTLVGGAITVSTTAVTGSSRIFLFVQTPGGTQGFLSISGRNIGANFTIASTSLTDTSQVAWLLIEPS